MKPQTLIYLGITLALAACTGCETVSSTAEYYRPMTTQTFPPKPKDYKAPVLGTPPDRPYQVIGELSFSAGRGYGYMIKAIEYNARKAGADAAIMLSSSSSEHQYTYTVPGYTTTTPVTTYSSGSAYGSANYYGSDGYYGSGSGSAYGSSVSTTYVPVYHPGYTGIGTAVRYSIDAQMIVYK
jgi:hypothetical protein